MGCWFVAIACIVAGMRWLVLGQSLYGVGLLVIGLPFAGALLVVLDYVHSRIEDADLQHKKERARQLGKHSGEKDVDGTPWQFG